MVLSIYVLKDVDVKEYGKLQLFENEVMAVRFLGQLIVSNHLENISSKFELVKIGSYDTTNGTITTDDVISSIKANEIDLKTFELKSAVEVK